MAISNWQRRAVQLWARPIQFRRRLGVSRWGASPFRCRNPVSGAWRSAWPWWSGAWPGSCRSWDSGWSRWASWCSRSISRSSAVSAAAPKSGGDDETSPRPTDRSDSKSNQIVQKRRAGFASGPKALGNGGVSSREDKRETALIW